MTEFEKLKREKRKLENRRKELEGLENHVKGLISLTEMKMADCYKDFFISKQNKAFKLYEKFPSKEVFNMYNKDDFPLNIYGNFNAKELAELIKQFYQFTRQKDYEILTVGVNEKDSTKDYGFTFSRIIPHLYFLIGNEKTLEPFREFDGKYYNNDDFHIYYNLNYIKGKDIVSIPLNLGYKNNEQSVDIEVYTNATFRKKSKINYYDYVKEYYAYCTFDKNLNIFKENLRYLRKYKYQGIKDVLNFETVLSDSFIAKALVSISIYKHNNQKEELTKEDYNHIFKELYGEEVDIISKAEKDIPKSLVYVPNEKEERVF